jgi:hypothetical protein
MDHSRVLNSSILQFFNSSIPQFLNSSILQFFNSSIPQFLNSSIPQFFNSSILQFLNSSIPQFLKLVLTVGRAGFKVEQLPLRRMYRVKTLLVSGGNCWEA